MTVNRVKKRDGRIVKFDEDRLKRAIRLAFQGAGKYDEKSVEKVYQKVIKLINNTIPEGKDYIGVEQIQDIIEITLMKEGYFDVAKQFILYREEKKKVREEKAKLLNKPPNKLTDIEKRFSINSIRLLASRYLQRDEKTGEIIESVDDMFKRVSVLGAIPEILYDEKVYDKEGNHKHIWVETKQEVEELRKEWKQNPLQFRNKYSILKGFNLNEHHFERLLYAYENLAKEGKMKVTIKELLKMMEEHPEQFEKARYYARKFFELMSNQVIMPNTPALVNSGRKLGMLSACFTLETKDSLKCIFETAKEIALISKAGGGIGINFSVLRPDHQAVPLSSTGKPSSGVISWLELYDKVLDVVKQSGIRRGAGMGILWYWHAEIDKFIHAKEHNRGDNVISNFNLSVGTDETFWNAVLNDERISIMAVKQIVDEETGEVKQEIKKKVGEKRARDLINEISNLAWAKGDPGILYFDNHNKYSIRKKLFGIIDVTNPCGEELLAPYESCNLSSINLEKFVKYKEDEAYFDWDEYHEVIRINARLLDNFIDVNNFPLKKIEERTKAGRNIGAGLMGLSNTLYRLKIPYNSEEGFKLMSKFAEHLTYFTYKESIQLAKERGTFSYYEQTDYPQGKLPIAGYYDKKSWSLDWDELVEEIKQYGVRNVDVTTSPPTGSVSMIADTSNGIEPNFALSYKKVVTVGTFYYSNKVLEEELRKLGLYNDKILDKIVNNFGSVQGIKEIPKTLQKVFVTSMDIHWLDHIIAQAMLQKWITNSISKTINMPNKATKEDVKLAYIIAHELECKGLTIYRDGSLDIQVYQTDKQNYREYNQVPSKYALKVIKELIKKKPQLMDFIKDSKLLQYIDDINFNHKKQEKVSLTLNFSISSSAKEESTTHKKAPIHQVSNSVVEMSEEEIKKLLGVKYCPVCYEDRGELVELVHEGGCETCPVCGWSACTVS